MSLRVCLDGKPGKAPLRRWHLGCSGRAHLDLVLQRRGENWPGSSLLLPAPHSAVRPSRQWTGTLNSNSSSHSQVPGKGSFGGRGRLGICRRWHEWNWIMCWLDGKHPCILLKELKSVNTTALGSGKAGFAPQLDHSGLRASLPSSRKSRQWRLLSEGCEHCLRPCR